jgi:transcriptional regulator with XRE-family HTH domain
MGKETEGLNFRHFPPIDLFRQSLAKGEDVLPFMDGLPEDFLLSLYKHGEVITYQDIGYYVRHIREQRGLTLTTIEKRLKVSDTVLLRIERGEILLLKLEVLLKVNNFVKDDGLFLISCWRSAQFHIELQEKLLELGVTNALEEAAIRLRVTSLAKLYRGLSYTNLASQFMQEFNSFLDEFVTTDKVISS